MLMDSGGLQTILMDSGGLQTVLVDSGGLQTMLMDSGGLQTMLMDSGGLQTGCWTLAVCRIQNEQEAPLKSLCAPGDSDFPTS
ncbi:uncharacterized protein V6R79_017977 [Siganus canaliculatus]